MPAHHLLISRQNGRPLKPYGVTARRNNNMKAACCTSIVILLTCSVCARADLEIYPGVKYGSQIGRTIPSDPEGEGVVAGGGPLQLAPFRPPPYSRWPWQKTIAEDDYPDNDAGAHDLRQFPNFDLALAELRRSKQALERARHEEDDDDEESRPYYARQHDTFEDTYGQFRQRVHHPQLDEARMYPQEDELFFKDDEDDLNEPSTQKYLKQMEQALKKVEDRILDRHEAMGEHHMMMDDEESAVEDDETSRKFKDVPFVKDPTDFAYSPPDPRFYEKPNVDEPKDETVLPQSTYDDTTDELTQTQEKPKPIFQTDKFNVHPRSDKYHDNSEDLILTQSQFHKNNGDVIIRPSEESPRVYLIAIVAGISAAATVGLIAVGIGWYNLQKHVKNASDVEYPAYGITGPNKDTSPSGDRRLAQSAQMYHYQHQKQQILAMENRTTAADRHGSVSEADSEEENEEGDYTVYECPGLAPTGEMEVKNPMFQDDPTPAQTPPVKPNQHDAKK